MSYMATLPDISRAFRTSTPRFRGKYLATFSVRPRRTMTLGRGMLEIIVASAVFWGACGGTESAVKARLDDNPIASCRTARDERPGTQCISLRLVDARVQSGANSGSIGGTVGAINSCDDAVPLLASPIDTRTSATDAWEESLGSVYARLSVYDRRLATGGLEDRGIVVHGLPELVIVPAKSSENSQLQGESARLAGVADGASRFVEFCTFAAPMKERVPPSATAFDIDKSIQVCERDAVGGCAVTLRRSAGLVCTPSFSIRVSNGAPRQSRPQH